MSVVGLKAATFLATAVVAGYSVEGLGLARGVEATATVKEHR